MSSSFNSVERVLTVISLSVPLLALAHLLQLFDQSQEARLRDSSTRGLVAHEIRWFDVQGENLSQLIASFRARAPRDHTGGACYGTTEWSFQARRQRVREQPDGARTLKLALDISLSLPRWRGYADADAHLKRGWDRFFHALVRHEMGHVRLALRAKSRLRKLLMNTRYVSARHNKNMVRKVASELIAEDSRYDERSFSGASQRVFIRQAVRF